MSEHKSKLKLRRAAGCVVYQRGANGALELLLINDRYGAWSLPKGHLERGECDEEAAVREVWEETGVRGALGPLVGRIEYIVRTKKGQPRLKQVAFFLMEAAPGDITPRAEEGICAAEWFAPEPALARLSYPQVRTIVEQALRLLA